MAKKVTKNKETLREKASKTPNEPRQKRRVLRSTAGRVRSSAKVLSPLTKPFKVKPVRKVLHIVGLVLFPRFFREAWKELKQVTWPGRKETYKLTVAVFIFAIIFGILIAITDYGLDRVFKKLLL